MASEPPTEGYGRGMRQARRSQRARKADLNLTGLQNSRETSTSAYILVPHMPSSPELDSHSTCTRDPSDSPATMAPSKNAEQRDLRRATSSPSHGPDVRPLHTDVTVQQTQQILASIEDQTHDTAVAPALGDVAILAQSKQPSGHPPVKEEQSYDPTSKTANSSQPSGRPQRVTKPQKSRKKKSTPGRAPTEGPSKRRRPATPEDNIQRFMTDDKLLQPAKLRVYNWEYPIPTDFLNLSEELKAAKARVDAEEGENDLDPELDDWHDFCGLESDLFADLSLKFSVGLNFVSRAKRAYRAGRTWTSFELEELAIDSRAGARALKDPRQREIALSSSLSNTLRLYVFEQIKVRLCHEIWLQPYPEDDVASMRDSAIGTAAPTPAPSDKTALEVAVQRMEALPDRMRTMLPGTARPIRTKPELPGRDRELHQPEGPPIRTTQANLRGLGVYGSARENGVHLDMQTSEEE